MNLNRISEISDALSHPVRLQIIALFLENEECLCGDFVKKLPLCQSTISQHLKKLKAVGLIEGKAALPKICYYLKRDVLDEYQQLLQAFLKR